MKKLSLLFLLLFVLSAIVMTGCKKRTVTPSVSESPKTITQESITPPVSETPQEEQPEIPSPEEESQLQQETPVE